MEKKSHIGLVLFLLIVLAAGAGGAGWYMTTAKEYETKFIEGTFVNGRNVGDMTPAEVEEDIRSRVEDYRLNIHFMDGVTRTLSMEDIGFSYNSEGGVQKILDEQNKYEWIRGKWGETREYTVGETYSFDEEKLRASLFALPEMIPENQTAPTDAYMEMGEDKRLRIVPECDGTQIDGEAVYDAAVKAVSEGAEDVDVTALDAYLKASVRADDPYLQLQVSDLNTYLDEVITYTLYDGTTQVIDKNRISTWLSVREDDPVYKNFYYFDVDKVQGKCREFVNEMADVYDYVKDTVTFRSSSQGDLTLYTEDYGRVIDRDAESAALYDTILSRHSASREPVYSLFRDEDGTFGGTYVEVDIENQHMWYYNGGDLYLDTDVVTGKASDESRRTPKGIFDIYTKERNRVLKGETNPSTGRPSYETPVNFWMPFYEGCGLHDANWRGSFGGDIYINNGSHGCVNMPYSKAEQLYEMVEVGTPVIVI